MESRLLKYALDGTHQGWDVYRLYLRCIPANKTSLKGDEYTCLKFIVQLSNSPEIFIPILEESGMIVEVGEWVLWQACYQAVAWQKLGLPRLRMSVNISALQFMRSDLDETVKRVLEVTELEPNCLCLELTESMVMADSTRTLEKMTSLSNIGVLFSLDDFGTGYSSLEYLGRLPINELKIDISFVRRMMTTRNDAAVVNTIIAMGQGLDMDLVAEGVETVEQLHYLVERKCFIIQGYYFSRPLKPVDFVLFCREWQLNPFGAFSLKFIPMIQESCP